MANRGTNKENSILREDATPVEPALAGVFDAVVIGILDDDEIGIVGILVEDDSGLAVEETFVLPHQVFERHATQGGKQMK